MGIHDHASNRTKFAIALLAVEVVIIVMYGVFVRPLVHSSDDQNVKYYPMYQDINVMMLIGFGFLMAFIKNHQWSGLAYTFFINAIIVQLYILLAPFWHKVFYGHWDEKITLVQKSFTTASYSVASVLIAFGAVLGRVGPLELLIMGIVQIIGYTLNQVIVYNLVGVYDVGGSTAIHTFGAYFGLTVSLILSKKIRPVTKPQTTYYSNIFGVLGTFFLWMYWPSFNAGYFPVSAYEKSVIITNTILSLTGSCLSTFIMTSFIRERLNMEDILNATLVGGVIIGAPAGIFSNPAGALCIGMFGGIISCLGYRYLQPKLNEVFGLFDTCGINNLHGMPGILGGIFSAIAIASYASDPLNNTLQQNSLPFYANATTGLNAHGRTFYQQGGIQIAGIFISMGIAICFAFVAGFLMRLVYIFEPRQFYRDDIYFQVCADDYNYTQKVGLTDTLDVEMKPRKLPPIESDQNLNV